MRAWWVVAAAAATTVVGCGQLLGASDFAARGGAGGSTATTSSTTSVMDGPPSSSGPGGSGGGGGASPNCEMTAPPGAQILACGAGKPSRLVVDASNVYWLDAATKRIFRTALASGSKAQLVNGSGQICDFAVANNHVYWRTSGGNLSVATTEPPFVPSGGIVQSPTPCVLSADASAVYFVNMDTNYALVQGSPDFSVLSSIYAPATPESLLTSDGANFLAFAYNNSVVALAKPGHQATTIPNQFPCAIASESQFVYWIAQGNVDYAAPPEINVFPVAGSKPGALCLLTAIANHIVWATNNALVMRTSGVTVSFPITSAPCAIAVDASHVYYADCTQEAIGRIPQALFK